MPISHTHSHPHTLRTPHPMKITDAFPSKYLRAADLDGRTPNVTIARVASENIGDDSKLVVYFEGKDKGVVLNKTNATTIVELAGDDDTDNWAGCRVKLITMKVEYQGKRVPAIRIEEADAQGATPQKPGPVAVAIDDDDIPFSWLVAALIPAGFAAHFAASFL